MQSKRKLHCQELRYGRCNSLLSFAGFIENCFRFPQTKFNGRPTAWDSLGVTKANQIGLWCSGDEAGEIIPCIAAAYNMLITLTLTRLTPKNSGPLAAAEVQVVYPRGYPGNPPKAHKSSFLTWLWVECTQEMPSKGLAVHVACSFRRGRNCTGVIVNFLMATIKWQGPGMRRASTACNSLLLHAALHMTSSHPPLHAPCLHTLPL